MRSLLLFLFSFLLIASPSLGQDGEQGYRAPLDLPLRLSGNFGELRSNHFHTGIDLKTRGRTGYEVKAIAEGHVSRIKVQEGGYGNALYIDHPDGNTSVYAHLKHFAPKVERFLRKVQYQRERNTIDLYPGKGKLPVKDGETVAISGNSGHSGAPHLHFEIRNTESEKPVDPLFFDFDIQDRSAPRFRGLRVLKAGTGEKKGSQTFSIRSLGGGQYRTAQQDPIEVQGRIGLAVRVTDRASGTHNPLGVQKLKVFRDDEPVFSFRFDTLDFSTSRFINAHIDHPYKYEGRRTYHRCHRLPHNELAIYGKGQGNGWLELPPDTQQQIRIEAFDRAGNKSVLEFHLKGTPREEPEEEPDPERYFLWDEANSFKTDGIELHLPPKSFYQDQEFEYQKRADSAEDALSAVHRVHDPSVPLHLSYTAELRTSEIEEGIRDKLYMQVEDPPSGEKGYEAFYDNGRMIGELDRFGELSIKADTIDPKIQNLRTAERIPAAGSASFHFRIEDEGIGLADYEARIGGHWRICRLDVKSGTLRVKMSDPLAPLPEGEHEFVLKVRDRVGNTARFKKSVVVE